MASCCTTMNSSEESSLTSTEWTNSLVVAAVACTDAGGLKRRSCEACAHCHCPESYVMASRRQNHFVAAVVADVVAFVVVVVVALGILDGTFDSATLVGGTVAAG